jgi:hypothetical protein
MAQFSVLRTALTAACLALSACAPAAPREITGLWARGPGGCEAQAGIRFEADAVRMVAGSHSEVLLRHPRYTVRTSGDTLRITIHYALSPEGLIPNRQSELSLERGADGWLRMTSHRTADGREGFARARVPEADPLSGLLRTQRCGAEAWINDLRGRPPEPTAQQKSTARPGPGGAGAGTENGGAQPPLVTEDQLRGRAAVLQDAT